MKPEEIGYHDLRRVEGIQIKDPYERTKAVAATVADAEARFRAHPAGADWIWEHYGKWARDLADTDRSAGDSFRWEHDWRNIDPDLLLQVFTFEEALKFRHGEVVSSEFGEWFDYHHQFLRKIIFAHWHYGGDHDWNMMVDHLDGFRRLSTDLPDFEVRIVHTRTINQAAWAWAKGLRGEEDGTKGLYLDASFGLLLYYKGKHVLTVGFVPMKRGVLVAQVQLRQKKGNRFLYHLPQHYMDLALDILYRAFGDQLWLVTGKSAVEAIRKAYGQKECGVHGETADRIQALYDRPLAHFERKRIPGVPKYESRSYVRLVRRQTAEKAA